MGKDQVRLSGVSGKPKPATLKVCIGYADGFIGEGYLSYAWPDALEKAKRADQMLRERFKMKDMQADEIRTDFIGFNSMYGS
ncbi:MAG: DUF1446 domain-containing protein, partial [Chloroflexi bacterium CG07_land_8_20_14_0_80_51_10]